MDKKSGLFLLCFFFSGCNLATNLSTIGAPPDMSQIQNPVLVNNYRPISMPMPAPEPTRDRVNSLWQTGSRAFFKDQRANRVGDIITVIVDLNRTAKIDTSHAYNKTATRKASIPSFFGVESKIKNIFPSAVDPTQLINTVNNPNQTGIGKFENTDKLDLKIGATIIQILPNGNLVIQGRQEVLIQTELRIVDIRGIIRREDIASNNTIPYSKIAEARIASGGRGDISDMNAVPWGQQVLNKVLPW